MVEHYELVIDGIAVENPFTDPDEILKDVVLGGYDKRPTMTSVIVWIHLPPNRVAVHLDFEQFKDCHRDGRLPIAHQVPI